MHYEPMSNNAFPRGNLTRIKDGVYVINFNDKQSKETHWIPLYTDRHTAVYFDSFGIKYIPQEVLNQNQRYIYHSLYI